MSHAPDNAVVWTELPVTDMARAMAFYDRVFGYALSLDESGPNPLAMLPTAGGQGVAGHLYPGKPAEAGQGPTVHLLVPDALEDAMQRCASAGGTVLSEPVSIPPGRFAYAQDPDGNSIGLFEPAG